jgi:HK97 gp10 family phage protein
MVEAKIVNLSHVLARLDPQLALKAVHRIADNIGELVVGNAAQKAPVDTGLLRASIAYGVRRGDRETAIDIGSNIEYAFYVEFGTGALTDWPGGGKGHHFPPPAKLERWARRHGFREGGGFLVARAIARRGGLPPRRFIRDAVEESMPGIEVMAQEVAREIEEGMSGD